MKILFAAAEVAPFAKIGGLGDVAGSLPKAISKAGHDIRVILPLYGCIDQKKYNLENIFNSQISLDFGGKEVRASLKEGKIPDSDVIVYFVANDEYFGSHNEIYPKKTYAGFDHERFVVFSLASLELAKKINFRPDMVHCNDWHAAKIPVYLKTKINDAFYKDTAIVYSIHNLAYQGKYSKNILEFANLDADKIFNPEGLEFHNDVNWMKGGIVYSDQVNTVSEKYAEEIQTPEYGEGLDGLLRANKYKLTGILNGIDYNVWNPETDSVIAANYGIKDLSGKNICKKALQNEFNLEQSEKPVMAIVSRLVDQKGLDLIFSIAEELKNMELQFIILGAGEEKYEKFFGDLNKKSENIRSIIGFDTKLARKIYAGSDMFLMPSRFEPCGLGQLISLRYGTIPVVRKTGGLADTVIDYNSDKTSGNGFVFENYDSDHLLKTIKRALEIFSNKEDRKKIIYNGMSSDFSWKKSADKYLNLYKKALQKSK